MLLNKYVIVGILFVIFNAVSLLLGTFVTYIDWGIVMFLSLDTEMEEYSAIPYVLLIGFLNDFFNSFLFGITPLVFVVILIVRFIFVKNFNFSEIKNVRYLYYITALILYISILLIFAGFTSTAFLSSLMIHFIMSLGVLLILKPFMEKKVAV